MRSTNNAAAVDTINAAASAIVSAETRVRPNAVPKRNWRSLWNLQSCFGLHKGSKRIGHAVLVPEQDESTLVSPSTEIRSHTNTVVLPFIAPPSSPASFLQSEPPSASQSPACLLSLDSLSFSPGGPASMFTVGPYAHETQLVTPPVFSAFPTEPSTAPFTPPPESVHMTTPSSPEVPFAQLVTSSLERASKNGVNYFKFGHSNTEFHPYSGSPVGQVISPGSVISTSGASSPFPGMISPPDLRVNEPQKFLGLEHMRTGTWGYRFGSGSVTPDGPNLGSSTMGSECATPDGVALCSASILLEGIRSRFGLASPILELEGVDDEACSTVENSNRDVKADEVVIDHRVSFALSGEEGIHCPEKQQTVSSHESQIQNSAGTLNINPGNQDEENEERFYKKQHSLTFGSIKEFNFDNVNEEVDSEKPHIGPEWWANEAIAGKESRSSSNWNFFRLRQPEVN